MSDNREQEETMQEVERVVSLACKHLGPNDQALLRWACGLSEPINRWGALDDPNGQLFV